MGKARGEYIYIYIYIYIQRERERERERSGKVGQRTGCITIRDSNEKEI